MSCSTKGQLIFVSQEPKERVIWGPKQGGIGQLWFHHEGGWLRQEWCGQFPDGTPRPPWHDAKFFELWEVAGPEAAQDKSLYDLTEQQAVLSVQQ